jgi:hypothetical protein
VTNLRWVVCAAALGALIATWRRAQGFEPRQIVPIEIVAGLLSLLAAILVIYRLGTPPAPHLDTKAGGYVTLIGSLAAVAGAAASLWTSVQRNNA